MVLPLVAAFTPQRGPKNSKRTGVCNTNWAWGPPLGRGGGSGWLVGGLGLPGFGRSVGVVVVGRWVLGSNSETSAGDDARCSTSARRGLSCVARVALCGRSLSCL
jgi:hypothetical protein